MGKARLLVIDDEAPLLRLMQTYLVRLGYDVEISADADEARQMIGRSADLQLAIADLSLLEGHDQIAAILNSAPRLRVLVCSGVPFEVDSLPEALQARCSFLQKPFLPKMLVDAVESLLSRPNRPVS